MNWKRIGTGTLAAGAMIFLITILTNILFRHFSGLSPLDFSMSDYLGLGAEALLLGFFCCDLYAIARPRLGPGPRTAAIVGTTIYLIKFGFAFIWVFFSKTGRLAAATQVLLPWVTFMAASYVAGWQYIERAP
jgi:hypothetical protein